MISRWRLLLEHIQSSAGNLSGSQRIEKRAFINQSSARAVDHTRAGFHLRETVGINETPCFVSQRRVDRKEVRAGKHLIETRDLNVDFVGLICSNERIVRHNAHAKPCCSFRHRPSGAFMTMIPRAVAAGTSILSTPTPARPITRRVAAALRISLVTFVSLLTIRPSRFASSVTSSLAERPVFFSTENPALRNGSSP